MTYEPRPDEDTIPGLRRSDTQPLPLYLSDSPAPPRGRHRRRMSRATLAAVYGVPVVMAAFVTGRWLLPGMFGSDGPRRVPPAVSSPSESAEPVAVPSAPLPSPSRVERSRSRKATPSPSTSTTASPSPPSPSPSPEPTPPRSLTPPSKPTPTTPTDDPPKPPPGDEGGGDDDGGSGDGTGDGTGSGGSENQGDQP